MKKTKLGDIPVDWSVVKLGEVAKISSGGTPLRAIPEYWGGDIPWIKTASIQNCIIKKEDVDEWITKDGLDKSSAKIVPARTILMAMYGQGKTRGQVSILSFDASINQACAAIELNENANLNYIYQVLLRNYLKIRAMSNTGGQENLSATLIKSFLIHLPSLPEQKAIASILSIWDEAIDKTEQLVKAKEKRFKWLLRELISEPRKGEGWKKVKLGDVCEMSSGGTPKSSVSEYYEGDILWVSISDMTKRGKFISNTDRYLSAEGLKNSSAKLFPKGSVLYAMYASIGEVSIANKEVATSQAILGIQPGLKLYNEYLYYHLYFSKEKIKLQGQAGTQSNLNAKMVKSMKILLPSITEQQQIVKILNTAHQEIDLLKQSGN